MKLVEMTLPNGYNVVVIEHSKSIVEEIWGSDYYHRHFTIKENMTVLDLGANLGFYSLYAASKGAKVYSVEPEERNYSLLLMNIEKNGLQHRITPINLAVANNKKYVYLYCQDFENEFASGMVSVSKEYIEGIIKGDMTKTRVPCAGLKQILDMIGEEKIDVMKIDCEGSELDIMQSASEKYFQRIQNIIMETHDSYAESDIFHTVKDLNYNIISYEKRRGVFCTGYLFATRPNNAFSKPFNTPVAIIRSPAVAIRNQKIDVNAADSFPTAQKGNTLKFSWFTDGMPLKHNGSEITGIAFKKPGPHKVMVAVSEDGRVDKEEANVFVLEENYYSKMEHEKLAVPAMEYIFTFKGKRSFIIPKTSLPAYWTAHSIKITLGLLDENEGTWKGKKEFFTFNGTSTTLIGRWKEITLPGIPAGLDIVFSLAFKKEHILRIIYWAEMKKDEKEKKPVYLKDKDIYYLTDIGLEHVCAVKNRHQFVIKNELLPKEWNLKTIVVAFTIRKEDENTTPLCAHFKCGNIEATLCKYHNEIKLPFLENESDIRFQLDTAVERDIAVKWWLTQ
jgi:FkbM family methyltransferase